MPQGQTAPRSPLEANPRYRRFYFRDQGRMALVSVNEYVALDGNTSGYTRSSPLAGTVAVTANEQHVGETESSVSCACPIDGFVDAWTTTMAPGGPVMRTVRQENA